MRKILLFLFALFLNLSCFSQEINNLQKLIAGLEQNIALADADSEKIALSDELEKTFANYLNHSESFDAEMKLKHISQIRSKDNKLNIITWNIPLKNGTFSYYGFLQYQNKKKIKITNLRTLYKNIQSPELASLRALGWHPILYYKLVSKNAGQKTYYTLLGWDGKDDFSNLKIIDILRFNIFNRPVFGDKIISAHGHKYGHIEFEYNERSAMNLHEYQGALVFDHLEPLTPQYKSNPEYYGPDGTYDGLFFENGKWILVNKIDVRNPKIKVLKRKKKKSY